MRKLLLSAFIFGLILFIQSCSPKHVANRAHRHFRQMAYEKAIVEYSKAISKGQTDPQNVFNLAESYRKTNNATYSEGWYKRALKMSDAPEEFKVYLADALMQNGKYGEAVDYLTAYLKANPNEKRAKNLLAACQNAEELANQPAGFSVKLTNINTEYADFGPTIHHDELVFSSSREKSKFVFMWNESRFLDLYAAPILSDENLGEPKKLPSKINSKYHEAITTYTPDDLEMLFTRNNFFRGTYKIDDEGINRLKIYSATLKNKKYKKLTEFPYNNDDFSVGHPSLTEDGKRLYFASDMPGGQGGVDIWYSDRSEKGWSQPVNLGDIVNTEGNEMFPWISSEGDLYLASNGHKGFGGLDIYLSKKNGPGFSTPKNLGRPINSPQDDFQLTMNEETGTGYFTSGREGGVGNDDIYFFRKLKKFEGYVIEAGTSTKVTTPRVEVYKTDKLDGIVLGSEKGEFAYPIPSEGFYYVYVTAEGYLPKKQRVTKEAIDGKIPLVIELEKKASETDCDQFLVLNGSIVDLEQKPMPNTKVKVILKEEYLVTDENGEFSIPVAPGQEYVVVAVGENGRPDKNEPVTTIGLPKDQTEVNVQVQMDPAPKDTGKVFYIIYYNYDKHNIRRDASDELNRVVRFMKRYPTIKVELGSHTDSRGTTSYNDRLSKNRAIEAFEYITSNGIEKERLTYKWYGESQLINECADGVECTETAHQRNRRTEFKFMGYSKEKADE